MKNAVKYLSDTRVEITVTVDAEQLQAAKQVATVKLARDVKVQGFRKGKVPPTVAAKNVDPQVLQEQVLNDALSKAVANAFLENELQALERPSVSITKFVPEELLEFKTEAEVLPKITLGNYKKLKAKLTKATITAKEEDEIIERMRSSMADKKEVKRAAKIGDEVTIDFVGEKDGVAIEGATSSDYALVLGSNSFIPGFEEGIVGHKAGDKFDLTLTFPKDYHTDQLKGALVVFKVTLKKVQTINLPELDDTFAAKVGPFTTFAELKADVKRELTGQREREALETFKDELVKQLIETSKIPVPDVLVQDQMRAIEQDTGRNLSYRGLTVDEYIKNQGLKDREEWLEKEIKPAAVKRVQAGLVLSELSKAEDVKVDSHEIDAVIQNYKQQYANDPETVKQFDQLEIRSNIANSLLTEKTLNHLVELNQ